MHSVLPTAELLTGTYELNYLKNGEISDVVRWTIGLFASGDPQHRDGTESAETYSRHSVNNTNIQLYLCSCTTKDIIAIPV